MKTPPNEPCQKGNAIPSLDQQRQTIRKRRLQLTENAREQLSEQIYQRTLKTQFYQQAENIALYLAALGEVETHKLLEHALSRSKRVYLPVLDPTRKDQMYFVRFRKGERLVKNRFGMPEPELKKDDIISAKQLDLVLCPLVAFDKQANRVGMGGGFYDRHFAFKNEPDFANKPPILIGLGYEFQQIETINVAPWDIPMSAIISESEIYFPRKN